MTKENGRSPETLRNGFAQIDFEEYIRRRDLFGIDMPKLIENLHFLDSIMDIIHNITDYQTAGNFLISMLSKYEMHAAVITPSKIPRAIALAAYYSYLPDSDPRKIVLPDLLIGNLGTERNIRAEKYLDFRASSSGERNEFYETVKWRDQKNYIDHWMISYKDIIIKILCDTRLTARIKATNYRGPDWALRLTSEIIHDISIELPFLDTTLKAQLVVNLAVSLNIGIIELEYDPETLHPEYYHEK